MFINNISVYIFAGMCYAIIDENMPDILSFPTSWNKKRQHYSTLFIQLRKINKKVHIWRHFKGVKLRILYRIYGEYYFIFCWHYYYFFSWYCPLQLQKHSFPTNFVYAVQWNCECFTISTNWKILSTNRILRQKKKECRVCYSLLFYIQFHSFIFFVKFIRKTHFFVVLFYA